MTDAYDINDTPALTITIKNNADVPIDPTGLEFTAIAPDGVQTVHVLTDSELLKDSLGVYHVDFLLTMSGRWRIFWKATGNISLAEKTDLWVRHESRAITLQEAKDHLNITSDIDDSLIDFFITAATEIVETTINRALILTAKGDLFSCLYDDMVLSVSNIKSISSITYLDSADVLQTLDPLIYELDKKIGSVRLMPGQSFPAVSQRVNPVTVNFVAGYGANAQDVPASIRSAMLLTIGHFDANREATVPITISEMPMGVKYLLAPYRNYTF